MPKPLVSFREKGVSASVFRNTRKDGSSEFYTATIENSFKDESGEFKKSTSYSEQELTALASVAMQARVFYQPGYARRSEHRYDPSSRVKGEADIAKYDKARRLHRPPRGRGHARGLSNKA